MAVKTDPAFPDDLLHALGALTVTYSSLDTQIKLLTWRLINNKVHSVGKIVTAGLSMANQLTLFSSLFRLRTRDTSLITRMEVLTARIDSLSRERNDMIHAIWVSRPDKASAIQGKVSSRRGSGLSEHAAPIKAEAVYALSAKIDEARREVVDLEYAIVNSSRALREE